MDSIVYRSRLDWTSWLMFGVVIGCCLWPMFIDDDYVVPMIVSGCMAAFLVAMYYGTYYRINGDELEVYTMFFKNSYPISKIDRIEPTKSVLSAPALSLSHRIAVYFTDRKVLRSAMPLIISPVRQEEFVADLQAINPKIQG